MRRIDKPNQLNHPVQQRRMSQVVPVVSSAPRHPQPRQKHVLARVAPDLEQRLEGALVEAQGLELSVPLCHARHRLCALLLKC